MLYHHISSTERLPLTTRGYPIIIWTKMFHQLHLIIPRESDCVDVIDNYQRVCDHLGVHYLELEHFDDAAMINSGSTESIYKVCSVY